jgi:hypothetical protein
MPDPAPEHIPSLLASDDGRGMNKAPALTLAPVPPRRRRARPPASRPGHRRAPLALLVCAALCAAIALAPASASAITPFLTFKRNRTVGSTVPPNGDLNPYGIVQVPVSTGALVAGNILISNFNNKENEQGTGTTIVQMRPNGRLSVFAQLSPSTLPGPCPGGVGLTTALAILPGGFVVVGSLPAEEGNGANAKAGCLIIINPSGLPVQTISGPLINGPWDLTAVNQGNVSTLFVSNVLNGTVAKGETVTDEGTVVRLRVRISPTKGPVVIAAPHVIAEGFPERIDKEALVIGPTGLALGANGTLFVANTLDNRIAAVPGAFLRIHALTGGAQTLTEGGFLVSPLGMTLAPNGDILTTNGGNGNIVETTPTGSQFPPLDTGAGAGGLFGLTVNLGLNGVYYVNDAENTLGLLH